MLGYRRLPELELVGNLANRALVCCDELQNLPATRLGDGIERI